MLDNTVLVDRKVYPTALRFSARFNVAVPFIDRHVTQGFGERTAIRSIGEDVSYATLAERVARCGNALRRLVSSPRARLLMIVKDCPEFFYIFWGAIKAGIVPVPLDTELRSDDYKFFIEDSRCTVIVYSPELSAEVEDAVAHSVHRPRYVLPIESDQANSLRAMMTDEPPTLTAANASADAECFWLYSSGSTDRPKAAVHRHQDMVMTSQLYGVDILGIRPDDICFSAAKLFFAYGLGNAMTFPLWVGATTVLLPALATTQSTFAMIERFRPTLYFGLPTLYAAQLQALDMSTPDLSSIRVCVSAGETLPDHLFYRWRERTGTVIVEGIGSTEALHIFISNRVDDPKPGTAGRIVPGYEAKILDERGRPVRAGESGDLHVRGHSIAKCYWNNPKRTRQAIVDGWLKTGDIFAQNSESCYVYCGRRDDMLKVSGTWCSPFEIETVLTEHHGVLEAAVVGRADADGLVKPEAWIVTNQKRVDPARIERELVQHCKANLALYKCPRWFHFVCELPRTATGKIQRFKLKALSEQTARNNVRETITSSDSYDGHGRLRAPV
jgi:benzoate-CoA ligase family protein